jgi:hypothetical protein
MDGKIVPCLIIRVQRARDREVISCQMSACEGGIGNAVKCTGQIEASAIDASCTESDEVVAGRMC